MRGRQTHTEETSRTYPHDTNRLKGVIPAKTTLLGGEYLSFLSISQTLFIPWWNALQGKYPTILIDQNPDYSLDPTEDLCPHATNWTSFFLFHICAQVQRALLAFCHLLKCTAGRVSKWTREYTTAISLFSLQLYVNPASQDLPRGSDLSICYCSDSQLWYS